MTKILQVYNHLLLRWQYLYSLLLWHNWVSFETLYRVASKKNTSSLCSVFGTGKTDCFFFPWNQNNRSIKGSDDRSLARREIPKLCDCQLGKSSRNIYNATIDCTAMMRQKRHSYQYQGIGGQTKQHWRSCIPSESGQLYRRCHHRWQPRKSGEAAPHHVLLHQHVLCQQFLAMHRRRPSLVLHYRLKIQVNTKQNTSFTGQTTEAQLEEALLSCSKCASTSSYVLTSWGAQYFSKQLPFSKNETDL